MPTVSVIICAYTAERWDDTMRAVASVQAQQPAPKEIILVVDHNPELLTRLAERLSRRAGCAQHQRARLVGSQEHRDRVGDRRNRGIS